MLAEAAAVHDKENARKGKARSGSVPPRATTPSENRHPPEGRVTRAVSAASNKRAKLGNSTSVATGQRIPSSSSRPTPSHELPHRAPFGSRSAALNSSTSSSSATSQMETSAPMTQKRTKTPASTIRRPASAASKSHPVSVQSTQKSSSFKLGVGRSHKEPPSSTATSNRGRAVSASVTTASKNYATNGKQTYANTRATLQPPSRTDRANRRESFRPRPSVDVGF